MFLGSDNLSTAVESAKERDLRPLIEEGAEILGLDAQQRAAIDGFLQEAWFFGVRTGYEIMVGSKKGEVDPTPVTHEMQDEFRDLMEHLAESLDTTVGATIQAWDYLGRAWIAGAQFWEVEIAARLIERQTGGLEEMLRRLED
jgi:hypothetical protein